MDYCSLKFNNINLDDELDGYTTVNVEGRGLSSTKITTINLPGRDGDIVKSKTNPPKDIKVHFLLKAENNPQWLKRIAKLNKALKTESEVAFSFGDEEGYRMGQVTEVTDPPYDQNQGIGTFTIHCSKPYMYGLTDTVKDGVVRIHPLHEAEFIRLKAEVDRNTKILEIKNSRSLKKIKLVGEFKEGQKLEIRKDTIKLNEQIILNKLDYVESEYKNFDLKSQDKIEGVGLKNIIVTYREWWKL